MHIQISKERTYKYQKSEILNGQINYGFLYSQDEVLNYLYFLVLFNASALSLEYLT